MSPAPAAARAPLHVISGASSDIGRAIALALAASERTVLALGRRVSVLKALARQAPERIDWLAGDLTKEAAMQAIKTRIARSSGVAALIHCAGEHAAGRIERSSPATLDRLYQVNLRLPYRLTQLLLPALVRRRGHVIFINSTAALGPRPTAGAYGATRSALRSLAGSLREEVNASGVRVTSLHLGRTSTQRMADIFRAERRTLRAKLLLQPEDIAASVLYVLNLPPRAEVLELLIRPAIKSY